MTKNARVRSYLQDGPSTCSELASIFGWSKREAHVAMWCLSYTGQVECVGYIDPPGDVRWSKRLKLWNLTKRGEQLAAKDKRSEG